MLTFELLQRPGQGMQRTRSSIAFWHSCWEVSEIRLEFVASKATCCGVRQRLTSFTVYIHGHLYDVIGKCSHLSCCRDQAKACSAPDPRLPSGTAVGK